MMFDSAAIKEATRKAAAVLIGFVLALIILAALLLTGMHLLVSAATLALAPHVGQAGALAISGLLCLLLVALFFYRLARPADTAPTAPDGSNSKVSDKPPSRSPIHILRSAIKDNPLEAAAVAFAAGIAGYGDSRLRQLLLQGGMAMMEKSESPHIPREHAPAPDAENPL